MIPTSRCPCTVNAFLIAVTPLAIRVTLRPPLRIAFYQGCMSHHHRWWTSLHHIFLRGGVGSASFSKIGSKIGTSVRSTLGTQALMFMRQFLEDAERENEKETGECDTELEVMDSVMEKTGACNPEGMDSSTSTQKVGAQKEAIMALRMLFEDFEDQVKHQDEVNEESASESEGSPERMPPINPLAQLSHILPHEEKEDVLIPKREPQLYQSLLQMRNCSPT